MELMGVCSICGRPGKLSTCMLCGRLVCPVCVSREGACIRCSHGRTFSDNVRT